MYVWPEVDIEALRSYRSGVVRDLMASQSVDQILLTGADHIRYATDFRAHLTNEPDWFVMIVDVDGQSDVFVPYVDEVVFVPDPLLPDLTAMHPLSSWSPALGNPKYWVRQVAAELRRRGARHVGYDTVDSSLLSDLTLELPGVRFTSVGESLYLARQLKHPIEIALIEAACRVNTGALEKALSVAAEGWTDYDVLAAASQYQQAAGVENVTHSVCNLRKGTGDWFAYGARLREGDAFFFDIGCYGIGGYASDAARTGFIGEPHPKVLRAFQHLLVAHDLAQSLVRPGVKASEVQAAVNGYLRGQGLGSTPYAVGHGIGLRICELPNINDHSRMDRDLVFESGHVIALEPETSVEVDGQMVVVKIEDNFALEGSTLRTLTVAPTVEQLII